VKKVPCRKDFKCYLSDLEKKIDSNTIAIVGSAPDYAYGLFDDIPALGVLA
jgi:glutamate/tyrosine decarboxylase-like PLP-dependent enzyme